jgi:nucleotidyltransferase substrate binding protein (TIGR01987 family)
MSEAGRRYAERRALLDRALDRFDEVLAMAPVADHPLADAAIQRFEFSIELASRCFQAALALEGVEARSPRAAVQGAYRLGWLAAEAPWLAMLEDRDMTSHTYRREVAAAILARLPAHRDALRAAAAALPAP